ICICLELKKPFFIVSGLLFLYKDAYSNNLPNKYLLHKLIFMTADEKQCREKPFKVNDAPCFFLS
ncbi:hypothetical protein, partial [Cytobacillus praedii]|uniref:hypothetical protein n=1 Tax=Cytobacillus praedii TaxID=1742358 RepID=UPI002E229BAF|nr:hypothetical protein [Cytobacillus praedii]